MLENVPKSELNILLAPSRLCITPFSSMFVKCPDCQTDQVFARVVILFLVLLIRWTLKVWRSRLFLLFLLTEYSKQFLSNHIDGSSELCVPIPACIAACVAMGMIKIKHDDMLPFFSNYQFYLYLSMLEMRS